MCDQSCGARAHRHATHRDVYNIGQIACCSLVRAIRFCARAQTRRVDQFHGRIIGIVHPFVSPTYEYTRQSNGRETTCRVKRKSWQTGRTIGRISILLRRAIAPPLRNLWSFSRIYSGEYSLRVISVETIAQNPSFDTPLRFFAATVSAALA